MAEEDDLSIPSVILMHPT